MLTRGRADLMAAPRGFETLGSDGCLCGRGEIGHSTWLRCADLHSSAPARAPSLLRCNITGAAQKEAGNVLGGPNLQHRRPSCRFSLIPLLPPSPPPLSTN